MNAYAGHTPFTEADIDLFLKHYSDDEEQAGQLKKDFLEEGTSRYLSSYGPVAGPMSGQVADFLSRCLGSLFFIEN